MSFLTLRGQMDDLMNQLIASHPLYYDPFSDNENMQPLTLPSPSSTSSLQPFQQQQQHQQQLSHLSQTSPALMRVDVHEDQNNYGVVAEIPGVAKENVTVSFDNGVLTIAGEKKTRKN